MSNFVDQVTCVLVYKGYILKYINYFYINSKKYDKKAHDFYFGNIGLMRKFKPLLVKKKIKTVGVDYLGIERNQPKHETHTLILGNEIAIIEGLRLEEATEGDYILYCLPLAVKGLEAAPVRAVLEKK